MLSPQMKSIRKAKAVLVMIRLFQWDTDHFSYKSLQENEDGTIEETSKEVVEGENVVSADAYVQTSMLLGKSYSELMMLTGSNSKAVLFAGVYEMVDNPRQAVLDIIVIAVVAEDVGKAETFFFEFFHVERVAVVKDGVGAIGRYHVVGIGRKVDVAQRVDGP